MKIQGKGKRLRIFIGESDKWHHLPLYQAIVQEVRKQGVAGATVVRGIEGFGAHSRMHAAKILRLSEDLPIIIEIVDKEERIKQILPLLDKMVSEGLITIEDVEIIKYTTNHKLGSSQE